jgi:hypothetical protein
MKNLIKVFVVFTAVVLTGVSGAYCFTATISDMYGTVKFVSKGNSEWQIASIGTELSDGDKIGTKENSWAEISFSIGHKAKLGPDSFMVINRMDDNTHLELFKGDLFSKVRRLSSFQSYEIKTPQSVASVKGTEFLVVLGPDTESTQIIVYEGSVLAKEILTGAQVLVPAGQFTTILENQVPIQPQSMDNLEKTREIEIEEQGKDEEEAEAEDEKYEEKVSLKKSIRQEIREAIIDIRLDVETAQNIVETTKDSDSETGRTLRDVHGNLVRVEQHIDRPNPETMHFINICKRSDYKYKGVMNVAETGARLDTFEVKLNFNMGIPDKISDWYGFFKNIADNDIDFHPETMEVKLSNQTDRIVMTSKWDPVEDEMGEPVAKYISAKEGTWNVLVDDSNLTPAQELIYNDITKESEGIMVADSDKLKMWAISPKYLLYKDIDGDGNWEGHKWVRSGMESWAINNEGDVIGLNMLTGVGGITNAMDIVRNLAFETSGVIRYNFDENYILNKKNELSLIEDWDEIKANQDEALAGFNRATDFFSRNIDLVFTPDIIFKRIDSIAKNIDFNNLPDMASSSQ